MNGVTAGPVGPRDCVLGHGLLDDVLSPLTDTLYGAPGEFAIARCPHCGLLQTVPRPDRAMAEALYAAYVHGLGGGRPMVGWPARLWRAIDGDVAFHRLKGGGRLLQIGCGDGGGLVQYREKGFEAAGLETDTAAAEAARVRGFPVALAPLAAFNPDKPFDIVVLARGLECTPDPRGLLGHVCRILNPGGEVWISLANADSAFRPLFGIDWAGWQVPYHLTHFDGPGLRRLLAEAGFEVFSFHNASPANWLARSVIARIYARPGEPTPRLRKAWLVGAWAAVLRLLLFPTLWMLNNAGRGDALVVRARKL